MSSEVVLCSCGTFPMRVTLNMADGCLTIRHIVCGNEMAVGWEFLRACGIPMLLEWVSDGRYELSVRRQDDPEETSER